MHLIVAAQSNGKNMSLPVLTGAAGEGALIRASLRERAMPIVDEGAVSRQSLLHALDESGAWIHVAAHGMAQAQRIGYSGIWLDPEIGETTPAFVSWIDVLDAGVRADLVVLDACQLGDNGVAVNGNLSFADAVARAGAHHVVAALWPVSDSAAALWVPAFYDAIGADPQHDAAEALRVAQQRLRDSRAFVHPFYWAGMQTIEALPLTHQ